MAFTRSKYGLINKYKFYKVDAVVYLEGGSTSYSIKDLKNNKYNKCSCDINYWQKMFAHFYPKKKMKFLSVGSKSTIAKVAEIVSQNGVKRCFAIMDKDHDPTTNSTFDKNNTIHSFGYSWENDILTSKSVCDSIVELSGLSKIDFDKKDEVLNLISVFCKKIRPAVIFDIRLASICSSFIPRTVTGGGIINSKNPEVNTSMIRQLTRMNIDRLKTVSGNLIRPKINPLLNCYGHMYFYYCYTIIKKYISHYANKTINKDSIGVVLVNIFFSHFSKYSNCRISSHYRKQFQALVF